MNGSTPSDWIDSLRLPRGKVRKISNILVGDRLEHLSVKIGSR